MEFVMCRSCGAFVPARRTSDVVEPVPDACPECEGTSFTHVESGRTLETT